MTDADTSGDFRLGWEEWVSLPDLGLPTLKAKVDTGARTSALHAFDIEPFGPPSRPRVRFGIHPIPGQDDVSVHCLANVIDRREVTSSNGETEWRYVIRTTISVGGRRWPIDVTLTDRGSMAYRMLLGRQALGEDIVVTPMSSFCQPELNYDVYQSALLTSEAPKRTLRIAILGRDTKSATITRLIAEGETRGHVVEVIDAARCYMAITPNAQEVYCDGKRLPRYDAVIPRAGVGNAPYSGAVIRQFEAMGTYCMNPAHGIAACRDKLHAHQVLARNQIGMPVTAFAASPKDTANLMGLVGSAPLIVKLLDSSHGKGVVLAETRKAAESVVEAFRGLHANFLLQPYMKDSAGEDIRCLVIGGRVVTSIRRIAGSGEFRADQGEGSRAERVKISRDERRAATRAAKAFRLNLATVDLLRTQDGPKVIEVNPGPALQVLETVSGLNLASMVFDEIEKRVRPSPSRRLGKVRG
ncbi:RimK family alpha-L-glutamate ligase [Pseudoruegeria sp. SK021]|uniref:RimK family alpha-L-glutamate ligase n=1 Tax=Pseudoruegeria sp. SK021 TaxID=1933035 RepID=UPI000A2398C3|nr:RimK family alpha-L-glutamate ligase [Pseudoruegeria sp. SK021]OSP56143.1 alpha-L-glutamate ligase [Pseudoruegeria sp. SK021]